MQTVEQNYSSLLVAEVELIYKTKVKPSQRPKITSAQSAYEILLSSWDERKLEFMEQAKVLLLNNANRVVGIYELSSGGITGTVVDSRLVFSAALLANATGIILSHNHPSGKLERSPADRTLTTQLCQAARLLEIWVLDHIIITCEGYYSFQRKGY